MSSSIIQPLFHKNSAEYEWVRNKFSEIIEVSLWPPSSLHLNPLDYAIWGVLENKTNATSHSNIGLLKTAIEEEWNKMSKEFILKACKSFQRRVDTIIEKMEAILNWFTAYNRVVYYYTRIFLILFL